MLWLMEQLSRYMVEAGFAGIVVTLLYRRREKKIRKLAKDAERDRRIAELERELGYVQSQPDYSSVSGLLGRRPQIVPPAYWTDPTKHPDYVPPPQISADPRIMDYAVWALSSYVTDSHNRSKKKKGKKG